MRSARMLCAAVVAAAAVASTGCGGEDAGGAEYALRASIGTYDDGSGRLGTALLATLRDATGEGPDLAWSVSLRDEDGEIPAFAEYDAPGAGSRVVRWRADVAPRAGTYEVIARRDAAMVRATVTLAPAEPLTPPHPSLSPAGDRIEWPPVPGAATYRCRVYARGVLQLDVEQPAAWCDVSALPFGAYMASIAALSADPAAVENSADPALPPRFDVSEATLGFARADASAPVLLRAAGGAYDNGVGPRSLAIWVSLAAVDGTATPERWEVEITGPGLSASAPLTVSYEAGFPRFAAWAPGVPGAQGTYDLTARSATGALATRFSVGVPDALDMPFGVAATAGAQGSARATWSLVSGAVSYLASAYDVESGELASSLWVGGAGVDFPAGTFVPGRAYEVLVAASDADMVWGAVVPTQISVVENVFDRATFVAR